jgi:hypothetical protein
MAADFPTARGITLGRPRWLQGLPPMTETDRANLVRDLGLRHDALLKDLDSLDQQIERTLAAIRPPSADAVIAADPGVPTY